MLKTTSRFDNLLGKPRIGIVVTMPMIYCRERTQSKVNKGKGAWDEVWRKPDTASESLFPESHNKTCNFTSRIMTTHVKCHPSGKLIRDSVPKVYFGGWLHSHPLSTSNENSLNLWEGKQMFRISNIVCNSFSRESILAVRSVGTIKVSKSSRP